VNAKEIYFDNSATTKPSQAVLSEILEALKKNYANASSVHKLGLKSSERIESSRRMIASVLGCKKGEIYFTSGGTEANNLAILGVGAKFKSKKGAKIVTTAFEHHSVLFPCKKLQNDGFEVVFLKPDETGNISDKEILDAIDERTVLVSMMLVNNEVGSRLALEGIKDKISKKHSDAIFHIDAVQSFCKIPTKILKLNCDLLTVSAHKIHGPQGIGALFCSDKIKLSPTHFGGKQEKGLRPGTECTSLISGFSKAVEEGQNFEEDFIKIGMLYDKCKESVLNVDGVVVNEVLNPFPYILNISIPGVKSEVLVNFLSINNIFVSNSSACAKGEKSHVLKAMGLPEDRIDSSIRVSFSKNNTLKEIEKFAEVFKKGVTTIKNKNTQIVI
jgi:cysteine desulfurase